LEVAGGVRILVVNAGSSTIKIKVYELADDPAVEPQAPVWESAVDYGE
jgi:acetate kinase